MNKELNQELFLKAYELAHKEVQLFSRISSMSEDYSEEIMKRVHIIYFQMLLVIDQIETDLDASRFTDE